MFENHTFLFFLTKICSQNCIHLETFIKNKKAEIRSEIRSKKLEDSFYEKRKKFLTRKPSIKTEEKPFATKTKEKLEIN